MWNKAYFFLSETNGLYLATECNASLTFTCESNHRYLVVFSCRSWFWALGHSCFSVFLATLQLFYLKCSTQNTTDVMLLSSSERLTGVVGCSPCLFSDYVLHLSVIFCFLNSVPLSEKCYVRLLYSVFVECVNPVFCPYWINTYFCLSILLYCSELQTFGVSAVSFPAWSHLQVS